MRLRRLEKGWTPLAFTTRGFDRRVSYLIFFMSMGPWGGPAGEAAAPGAKFGDPGPVGGGDCPGLAIGDPAAAEKLACEAHIGRCHSS